MKIIINSKNLVVDDSWQVFYKVRAVIKNSEGKYAISTESGKCIFPGGKCEAGEDELLAVKRELYEELGIKFEDFQLREMFVLEALYDDYYDFRTGTYGPRYTVTKYFCGETDQNIDYSKMNLTEDELSQEFKSSFVSFEELVKMIKTDHSSAFNGKYFDDENKIVLENIIRQGE